MIWIRRESTRYMMAASMVVVGWNSAHAILMNCAVNKFWFIKSQPLRYFDYYQLEITPMSKTEYFLFLHNVKWLTPLFNLVINVFESQWNNCTRIYFNLFVRLAGVSFLMLNGHRCIDGCRFNEISFMFALFSDWGGAFTHHALSSSYALVIRGNKIKSTHSLSSST